MSEEQALKVEFARMLLKTPEEAFKIALLMFPNNNNRALRVAMEWPTDEVVKAAQTELLNESGEDAFLPTKAEFARELLDKMHAAWIATEDYIKVAKLYADIRGFVQKPVQQTNIDLSNKVQNNVMIIKENGSDDEWEKGLREQQAALIDVSTT